MAARGESCETNSSAQYWQEIRLQYEDGVELQVVLDKPTVNRLEQGDDNLMKSIRATHTASLITPDCPSSHAARCLTTTVHPDLPTNHNQPQSDQRSSVSKSQEKFPKNWTKNETSLLFSTRKEMENNFRAAKSHKQLWQKVATVLSNKGYSVNSAQCENKFKSLKREYRATVDHNHTSGNDPKQCSFYEEFSEMYGMKAGSRPAFTLSSTGENVETDAPKETPPKRAREASTPKATLTLAWLKEYEERQLLQQQRRLEELKKMHSEKLAVMERLISVLDKRN